MKYKVLLPLGSMMFCVGGSVQSQESHIDTIVVTGSYAEQQLQQVSNNISLISRDQIKSTMAITPADILNSIPGVLVQTNNGMESLPALRSPVLTGPGAAGAYVFAEDGISTRAAGFANNNALAEFNLNNAQQIEIIKGPSSAIYGSNAVHGVVNVLTGNLSQASSMGLTWDNKKRTQVFGNLNTENVGLALQHVNDAGYRADSDYVSSKLNAKFENKIANVNATTTLAYFDLDQETAGFVASNANGSCFVSTYEDAKLYKDKKAMKANCDPDAYRKWRSFRMASALEFDLSNNIYISITPYLRSNKMEFRQHYLPSRAIEENQHESLGVKSNAQHTLNAKTTLVYGVDAELTHGALREIQEAEDKYSWGKARQQGLHYDYEVDASNLAAYLQMEHQLAPHILLSLSARHDYTQYDYDNLIADGTSKADGESCTKSNGEPVDCLYLRPSDRSDSFSESSFKLGTTYQVSENSSLFASIANGFRAPQTTDLYRLQNQQTIGELSSEKIQSAELGYRLISQYTKLEAAIYRMQKENFFFRDSDGLNVTDGITHHTGLEMSLYQKLSDSLSLLINTSLADHQYAFTRASSGVIDGNQIDTAPKSQWYAKLNWQYNSDLKFGITWQKMGKYYLDPANLHEYSGHQLVNLSAQYKASPSLSLHLKIHNLLDEYYASRADYAFGSYRFFGGSSRYAKLGITYVFN